MSDLQRAEDDEILARNNGFSPAAPIYELGTPVNNWGVDNARKSRNEWQNLPLVEDACNNIIEIINKEDRHDISYELNKFSMNEQGLIVGPGTYSPTMFALGSLIQRTRVTTPEKSDAANKAASFVSDFCSPKALRREVVNYYLSTSKKSAWLISRVHTNSVGRELFVVFTDKYDRNWTVNNVLELFK